MIKVKKYPINDLEFNRVIGNGLVKGSVILLGGRPGIGKYTLTLKIALTIKKKYYIFMEKKAMNK